MISHMSAGRLAAQRIGEMLEEYKLADIEAPATTIFQRSENAMREAIKKVEDGEYRFQVSTDGYDEPLVIRVGGQGTRQQHSGGLHGFIPTGRPRPERRSELRLFLFRLFAQMPVLSADSQQRGQLPARDGIGPRGQHTESPLSGPRERPLHGGTLHSLGHFRRAVQSGSQPRAGGQRQPHVGHQRGGGHHKRKQALRRQLLPARRTRRDGQARWARMSRFPLEHVEHAHRNPRASRTLAGGEKSVHQRQRRLGQIRRWKRPAGHREIAVRRTDSPHFHERANPAPRLWVVRREKRARRQGDPERTPPSTPSVNG